MAKLDLDFLHQNNPTFHLKCELSELMQQYFRFGGGGVNPKSDSATLVQQSFLAVKNPKIDLPTLVQHRDLTF